MRKNASDGLTTKLIKFITGLDESERYNFHLMLSAALSNIAPSDDLPKGLATREAWKTGLRVLAKISPSGLRCIKRPSFIIDEYLGRIIREAESFRSDAERLEASGCCPAGPIARDLANDPRFANLVNDALHIRTHPISEINYHYYDQVGDRLDPHVDPERTSCISCIVGIAHHLSRGNHSGSALRIYRPDLPMERIWLEPGDVAVLLASGTVHGRDAVADGEEVITLTIGFHPIDSLKDLL